MASEFLVCPNCRTTLKKPVQYQVLGDVAQGGGSFIALGDSDTVPCAVCGFAILKMDIVEGKLDRAGAGGGGGGIAVALVVIAVVGFLLYSCSG